MTRVTPAHLTTPALSLLDKVKFALYALAGLVVAAAVLWGVYAGVKSWNTTPPRTVQPPATVTQPQTALYQQKCGNGKIMENVTVTSTAIQINPNPHHCGIRWVVKSGTIKLVGSSVPFGDQMAGAQTGETKTGTVTSVVAVGGNAVIDYQICPATHRIPGWC